MPKLMGLDYGLKHIGVAISVGSLAEPLTSLDNNSLIFPKLAQLVATYQIEQLVLGYSEGEMAKKTLDFGQKLAAFLKLPISYADETLSSREASAGLTWLGGKKSRRQPIHQLAAAIILENFIDEQAV